MCGCVLLGAIPGSFACAENTYECSIVSGAQEQVWGECKFSDVLFWISVPGIIVRFQSRRDSALGLL